MNAATQGLSGAARRVADHARSLVQLELRLAVTEIKRKIAALAPGIGLVLAAAVLGLLALLFGRSAATAASATALCVWRSLPVMCGGLLRTTGLLGAMGA